MDLDQAFNSALQITNVSSIHQFQPFDSLPDEVLLLLLDPLTPFQRCLILSICRKWNQVILGHKRWWQYLDIPHHLPFSTALSILQTFNSRSDFTLKHVIIQPLMTTSEENDEVFTELKKSSDHVKLLLLNQSDFMLTTRRDAQEFLPRLITFCNTDSFDFKQRFRSLWDERDSLVGVVDEEENGLQFLHVADLEELEPDELEWFSKLKYLSVEHTDSVENLRAILDVAKKTLVRLRLNLWEFDEDLEHLDLLHANDFQQIKLPSLTAVFTPNNEASATALGSLIDFGGQQGAMFFGFVHALLHFDFPSLGQIRFRIYESENLEALELDEEESKLKTIQFFERNPSIFYLQLDRYAGSQDGESFHLNFVLQSLSIRQNSEFADESGEKREDLLLPKLRQLSIDEPETFDKKLLKQFWETRKAICKHFTIQVRIEGNIFQIDRSGGEEWLDAAESCE